MKKIISVSSVILFTLSSIQYVSAKGSTGFTCNDIITIGDDCFTFYCNGSTRLGLQNGVFKASGSQCDSAQIPLSCGGGTIQCGTGATDANE